SRGATPSGITRPGAGRRTRACASTICCCRRKRPTVIDAVVNQRVDVGVLPDVPSDGRFRREICVRQGVVAIVHPSHPLAQVKRVSCAELARHRLIFRTKQSSTQRVVDRAFRTAGVKPKPEIVLDTRDGVFEAVANELGIGFTWEYGSSRADKIVRVHVPEMAARVPEHIFSLAGRQYSSSTCSLKPPARSSIWRYST